MDIHPPHPIHSWKDFFLQLVTITAGLFIALSLEAAVEWGHHHALVREARENLQGELDANRNALQDDLQNIAAAKSLMQKDLEVLRPLRSSAGKGQGADFGLHWRSLSDSAWRTARDAGALAYMPQSDVRSFAGLYALQEQVEHLAADQMLSQAKAAAPLLIEQDKPSAAQIDETLHRTADNLTELDMLGQILQQLGQVYANAAPAAR